MPERRGYDREGGGRFSGSGGRNNNRSGDGANRRSFGNRSEGGRGGGRNFSGSRDSGRSRDFHEPRENNSIGSTSSFGVKRERPERDVRLDNREHSSDRARYQRNSDHNRKRGRF